MFGPVVHAFQEECNFKQIHDIAILTSVAGLYANRRAVFPAQLCAISPGCAFVLLPLNINIFHQCCTESRAPILTNNYDAIWVHMEAQGFNHWVQSKALEVTLDQGFVGHDPHSLAWNRGMHADGPMLRTAGPTFWRAPFIKHYFRLHQVA